MRTDTVNNDSTPLAMPLEDGQHIPIPDWVNVQVGDTVKVELFGQEAKWFLNGVEVTPPESDGGSNA